MATYTRAQFRQDINRGIKGKIGILLNDESTMNEAVREVISDVDIRSNLRKTDLTPNLFSEVHEYAAPNDLKGMKVVDIVPQPRKIRQKPEYRMTSLSEFNSRPSDDSIAIQDNDMVKKILIRTTISDTTELISGLNNLTDGGGTWEAVGDAENLRKDTDNFIRVSGSVRFDIGSGGTTTAGIKNTSLNSTDITDFLGGNGAAFVWTYINTVTDLNSFTFRIGSGESDYYEKTVTADSNNNEFTAGWNLLKFDLTNLTTTGTPDDEAITFSSIFMNKETGKVSETDYRFDYLILRIGEINDLFYYTKFGWQNSSGSYKENSTASSDLLNVDTDEYNLYIQKGIEIAAGEVDEENTSLKAMQKYENMRREYELNNPSLALSMIDEYYSY